MRVLAFVVGLILLLPGVCAFGFMLGGVGALPPLGSAEWRDGATWGIIGVAALGWGLCYLISFGGVLMIRAALNPAPEPLDGDPPETPPGD